MSPISARWPGAAGGTAPKSTGSRTIMSSSGAITRAKSRFPAGVVAKPPAEYHRARKGLLITPLGSPDAYAPAAGFRRRLAGRLRSQGRHRQPRPLLRHGRGRPRPVARHRHRRRALRRHRPRPAPPRPQHRARRADRVRASSICRRCRAAPRRSASTRSARRDVPIVQRTARRRPARRRAAAVRISRRARRSPPICTHEKTGRTISSFVLPAGQICATSMCRCGPVPAG